MGRSIKGLSPTGRVSFPQLFEAKYNELNKKNEFSVDILFNKDTDLSALKEITDALIKEEWGGKPPAKFRMPFKNGNEKLTQEGKIRPEYKDTIYIKLKSTRKPGVVDANVQEIIDPTAIYGGCEARVSFSAYSYDNAGNKGINFGLDHIQKVSEGEPFGQVTANPDEVFEKIEGGEYTADNADLLG